MTQQMLQNEKGMSGVLQTIASNGFSLDLTDPEADQLVTDFLAQGIDSWSKLFAFLTTDVDIELSAILNNRAEAANLFTDLLAEQKRDSFYNSSQATNAAREWLADIDASNESLLAANSTAQGLINSFAIELSAISRNDNNSGFVINGETKEVTLEDDYGPPSISGAGDVNGDGFADLIVGTYFSNTSFVVFGKENGNAIELTDVEDGSGGFVINGVGDYGFSGSSVNSAGDINGDGLADLIVGSRNGPFPGFVVFGKDSSATVESSDIDNAGIVISGVGINGNSGNFSGRYSFSSAGDVNGDGLADLIVGVTGLIVETPGNDAGYLRDGASFVIFGKNDNTTVELYNIASGNGGFVIYGADTRELSDGLTANGFSVSGAGDVNGDGLADLIVGAPADDPNGRYSGASFVVFGKDNGTVVELTDIEGGSGGFVINGVSGNDQSGFSVSDAGDVNGDGLADLIVGAPTDDPNGSGSGASFVVFGKNNGAAVELSDIENSNGGFAINGVSADDFSGDSVSSAGDVNGDGFADLNIGAFSSNSNPNSTRESSYSSASFVIFGGQSSAATVGTSGANTLAGDNSANQLVAGAGDDTLIGNGGADVLRGGAGNDILAISDLTFLSLDGGTGNDTLRFDVPLSLDLRTLADTKLVSIEVIDLTNDGGNSTISLNLTDLLNLNEAQTASDTLVIHGNAGDIVNLDNTSNGQTGNWANAGSGVYEFTAGEIGIIGTVTIDAAMTVNII